MGAAVGIAAVVALMLAEAAASILGVDTGVCVGVVVGVGVAVGVSSKGITLGGVNLVHATRDTSITRANFIRRFIFQVIQRHPCLAGEPVTHTRPLCLPF